MTALGAVVVWRAYFACRACGTGGYLADAWLGLEGYLTRGATRLICLLGGRSAFAVAERLLIECLGWKVSDETIRRACQAESSRIAAIPGRFAGPRRGLLRAPPAMSSSRSTRPRSTRPGAGGT